MNNGPLALNATTTLAFRSSLEALDNEALGTIYAQITQDLAEADATHERATAERRARATVAAEVVAHRIDEAGGRELLHPDFSIGIVRTQTIEKRISELRALEGMVPEKELREALCLRQAEPEWWAHAGKLQALARKYGGKVAAIIDAGIVRVQSGPTRLRVTYREPDALANPPQRIIP